MTRNRFSNESIDIDIGIGRPWFQTFASSAPAMTKPGSEHSTYQAKNKVSMKGKEEIAQGGNVPEQEEQCVCV